MNITRLEDFVIKKSIRAESIPGYEEMEVFGVSNKLGITVTDHKKSKDLAKYLLIEEGDFAYNPYRINVGSVGLTPAGINGLVSPAYVVFTTTNKLIPELLLDFLKSQEGLRQIGKYARGTVRKALRFEDLSQIELPVPPIEQQLEILSKRRSIETEVKSVKSELTHQQTLLKKLRQQILQEAIEGKLTADWRAQNPNIEPASELLKRIAAEKAQLVKDKKIKAQKPLPPITAEEKPFNLPQGWAWCRLGDLVESYQNGISKRSGSNGIPVVVLRLADIENYEISLTSPREIVLNEREQTKYFLLDSDILITRVNGSVDIVGNFNSCNGIQDSIAYCDHFIRMRLASNRDLTPYIMIVEKTNLIRERVKAEFKTTSGQKTINQGHISNFLIPLPPLTEQQAIVTKVENLLALCDQLETQITQNQIHAEQLMQAVLKEAFSHNNAAEPAATTPKVAAHTPLCQDRCRVL